jgi:plastocyanin
MTAVTFRVLALSLAAFAGLAAGGAAHCTAVTVAVTSSTAGAPPEDAILVFDPLDGTVAPGHAEAVIDQLAKQFVPKVTVLRTGTTVLFKNSDRMRHQVYSFSPAKNFTLKLSMGPLQQPVVFDKPGLVVLGCNIHDNMIAFVGVVDSPYFAKTPKSGSVTLNLPAGRYRLRVWHPNLSQSVAPREVTVSEADMALALALDLSSSTPGATPWP